MDGQSIINASNIPWFIKKTSISFKLLKNLYHIFGLFHGSCIIRRWAVTVRFPQLVHFQSRGAATSREMFVNSRYRNTNLSPFTRTKDVRESQINYRIEERGTFTQYGSCLEENGRHRFPAHRQQHAYTVRSPRDEKGDDQQSSHDALLLLPLPSVRT